MRALRSDQAEQEGTDFVTILNATQKKLHPDSELHDWSARYKTIQKLAEDLVKDFRKHAPVQTNQTLLQRLHALETENDEDLEAVGDGEATADFRSPAHDLFEEEEEENKDPGPIDAQDTLSQYLPSRDSTLYLENCSLEGHNIKSVNNWLASTAIGKGKNKVIDTAVSEFVAACAKLDDGSRKPVDKIAVEWGLSVSLASKLNEKCLTRLIAGAHLLANQFSTDIFVRIRDLLVQFRDRVQFQVLPSIMATRQASDLQMHDIILDHIGDRCIDGAKGGDYLLEFIQDCGNGLNVNVIYMNRLFVMISPQFIQQFIETFDKCEDFRKARPIIACDHCWHSRLTTFLAKAIFQIMLVVFPTGSTFNALSVQEAVRMMWHSMMGFSADEPTVMKQQDLIGFFNSVPHDRISQSLLFVLQLLEGRWQKPWQSQSLQVSGRSKDLTFRVFRGRRRFAARNTKTLHLEDLPELVVFLLRSSFFRCGFHTFRQIQGASMGSALAPVLCTLVASTIEFLWLRNFRTILNNIGFQTAARYADNRVFHVQTGIHRNPWLQLLFHLEFYGAPIILEDVSTKMFLGTTCSVTQGTITVVQPTDASTIRTLQSAVRVTVQMPADRCTRNQAMTVHLV
ncbi:unnamed protein product [Symbiodinium sp. CCMP2592]|nr:unnamed protein product [Symbiodinium sp. CCMP2592]